MNAELRVIGFRLGLSSEANARFRERALRWITADAPRPLPSLSQAPSWVDLIHAPLDNLQSRYALPDAFRADIVAFLDALGVRARPPEAERPTRAPARPPSIRRTPTRARAAAPEQPTWRRPSSPGLPERFEAAELLGAGGMGEVYRVRDRRIGRHVALKVLRADWANDAEIQARFIHEAPASCPCTTCCACPMAGQPT
jgi:hypothetical protein